MNPVEPHITPERVKELFDYNPETGELWRRKTGIVYNSLTVWIDGRTYEIGRVIWCWWHEEWPPQDKYVDHIDMDRTNNKIENYRLASPSQNSRNQNSKSVFHKGVTFRAGLPKPWQARITVEGTRLNLGFYSTHDEAAEAYRDACVELHGEFARHD